MKKEEGATIFTTTERIAENNDIDLELIMEMIGEKNRKPIPNSFLDMDESMALSEWEMEKEQFGKYSYMAN